MASLIFLEPISLAKHQEINEKQLQALIADNPSILGLGELVLKDQERSQPRAGRLDLLLQDPENYRRYEVEIQLGKTDESHIIRTLEYWDIEKRRYPQYDHCAVIIAEEITSRFLNVISLFNGSVPLVAIQINAVKVGDKVGEVFTKVLDELPLGIIEEDEDTREETNRDYWLNKSNPETVKIADQMLELVNSLDDCDYKLNYNKHYIGLVQNGRVNNFVVFRPKKRFLNLNFRHPKTDEIDRIIEENGLVEMDYDRRRSNYRLQIFPENLENCNEAITNIIRYAERYRNS